MDVTFIPLDAIDADALIRDRTVVDEAARRELYLSILLRGLRTPIEVFALTEPEGGRRYGLISGRRRLDVFRELAASEGDGARWAAIPAFLREPGDMAEAMVAMVEENAVRAGLSPWEQARVAVAAARDGVFGSIDAAVEGLYPSASRHKHARIRAVAGVVDALEDALDAPEGLSERLLLRLSAALALGYGPILRATLEELEGRPGEQPAALAPILAEAEALGEAEPDPRRPGRPRRRLVLRRGLSVRREMTSEGWLLRFTGPEARSELMDRAMDELERMFGGGEPARRGW